MTKKAALLLLVFCLGNFLYAQKPKLFVLAVGVSQYKSTNIENLNFADNDARDLAAAFQNQNGLWNVREVKVLTDAQATRKNIRSELDRFAGLVNSDDYFIFIFSGHGGIERLLPHDTDGLDVDGTTLSKSDISLKLNALGCGYLVFLDACHSGSFAKSYVLPGGKDTNLEKAEAGKIDKDIRDMLEILKSDDKPCLLFGSSGSSQKSWECEPCQNGYFAQTILDALDNKSINENGYIYRPDQNGDKKLSVHELDEYIKNAVRVQTIALGSPQKVYSRLALGDDIKLFRIAGADEQEEKIVIPPPEPRQDDLARDLAGWRTAKAANTAAGYQKYLADFPNGEFREQAKTAFSNENNRQRDDTAFDIAVEKNTEAGYQKYLNDFPNGWHRSEATEKMNALKKMDNMVLVRGGTFQMGSNDGEADEKPVHSVTVSDFYLSKFEVTVAEFKTFVEATGYQTDAEKNGGEGSSFWNSTTSKWELTSGINWRHDAEGKSRPQNEYNHPIIHVSWNDAVAYCDWLSKTTGQKYHLPTEAEWEFAARGGNQSKNYKYAGSSEVDEVAWYLENSSSKTHPVGQKKANELGIFDMSGNVWEWCSDWYAADFYKNSPSSNPTGAGSSVARVDRGGGWGYDPQSCRAAFRDSNVPTRRNKYLGFRLARSF